jgi:hypothetical protein
MFGIEEIAHKSDQDGSGRQSVSSDRVLNGGVKRLKNGLCHHAHGR